MTEIKAGNYSVFVSKDSTKEINRFLKANETRYSKLFILVDENTLKQCYPQLVARIPAFEDAEIIEIESGEKSKNIEVCLQIWATLSDYGADRQSLIVNLGGGVIGEAIGTQIAKMTVPKEQKQFIFQQSAINALYREN